LGYFDPFREGGYGGGGGIGTIWGYIGGGDGSPHYNNPSCVRGSVVR